MIERALMWLSARLPAREIRSPAGQPYLERHHVCRVLGATVLLHRYLGSDGEREVHNHPWSWAFSIVLKGWYVEERVLGLDAQHGWRSRYPSVMFFNWLGPMTFHRLHHVREGTWTLFVHGPRRQAWGFLERLSRGALFHQPHQPNRNPDWHRSAAKGVDLPSRQKEAT